MSKKKIRRIVIIVALALLAVFVAVQIFNQFRPRLQTETATHATVTDSLRVEGLTIRKEEVIKNNSSGVISYEVADGAKVAKNGTIASIYSDSEAAAAESKRMELKNQLSKLQALNKSAGKTAVSPDNVNKQIYQKVYSLKNHVNNFNLSNITTTRDEALNLINQWQLSTGKIKTFTSRIQALKTEISNLSVGNSASGSIKATAAGYFVREVDGYETVYDYDNVKQLTVEDLGKKQEAKPIEENVIGKVCEQFDWYIACVVPADTAIKLTVDDKITIKLPFASSADIPAKVVAVNQPDIDSQAAVVLECSNMDATLANIREETVLLNIDTYDGIKISQKAIHFQNVTREVTGEDGTTKTETKEVKGVYVVNGSELKFVEIVPLYTSGNYVICNPDPDLADLWTDSTISLYDTVAIGGGELYDGKVIT